MLHSNDNAPKPQFTPSTLNPVTPVKTVTSPIEQATIGRTVVIKGEVTGSESLYIDGRIEGTVNIAENRVTIGRNGIVNANVSARPAHRSIDGPRSLRVEGIGPDPS